MKAHLLYASGQFLHALTSKSDDVEVALGRLADITTEEERMSITELVVDMHELWAFEVQNGMSCKRVLQSPVRAHDTCCIVKSAVQSFANSFAGIRPLIERTDTTVQALLLESRQHTSRRTH